MQPCMPKVIFLRRLGEPANKQALEGVCTGSSWTHVPLPGTCFVVQVAWQEHSPDFWTAAAAVGPYSTGPGQPLMSAPLALPAVLYAPDCLYEIPFYLKYLEWFVSWPKCWMTQPPFLCKAKAFCLGWVHWFKCHVFQAQPVPPWYVLYNFQSWFLQSGVRTEGRCRSTLCTGSF